MYSINKISRAFCHNALQWCLVWLLILSSVIGEWDDVTGFPCLIPEKMRSLWYSYESGEGVETRIEAAWMNTRGTCIGQRDQGFNLDHNFYLFESEENSCRSCVAIYYRTRNVLEYKSSSCQNWDDEPKIEFLCSYIYSDAATLTTMFRVTVAAENCRSSFEGIYQFRYERGDGFDGYCSNARSNITACQVPGSYFNIQNQKFLMSWKECEGNTDSFNQDIRFQCLGQWTLDNGNRYIAVANLGDERKYLRYRCMLTRSDQPLIMSMSDTATCNTLKNAKEGPFEIRLTEVKGEPVVPRCQFPTNFTGYWVNTAEYDSKVEINATHIYEVSQPDQQQPVRAYYVCHETIKSRYMVAKLGVGGCHVDYYCFDFLPRHQNVIRYRKSRAFREADVMTVCSWSAFENRATWKYNIMLQANPYGIECPIRGKFKFSQMGDARLLKKPEVTQSPRDQVDCREVETVWGSCAQDVTRVKVDVDRCATVDHRAKPIGEYDIIDYDLKCIGFWKEDDRSYMITYNEEDPFSKYQCWVYRRLTYNSMRLSKGARSFCHENQSDASYQPTEGASLRLDLSENERIHDNCPLHFDDGSDPYAQEIHITVFDEGSRPVHSSSSHHLLTLILTILITAHLLL